MTLDMAESAIARNETTSPTGAGAMLAARPTRDTVRVVLFAGGRGGQNIARFLLTYPHIDLTIIVNAYDDGLSTGALRRYVPGMLGPSDIRKNLSNMIVEEDRSRQALKALIEYRFPEPCPRQNAVAALLALCAPHDALPEPGLAAIRDGLSIAQARALAPHLNALLSHVEAQERKGVALDFSGMSLGNLLFMALYLQQGHSFNEAIRGFSELVQPRGMLLNIDDGKNLVLVGLKEDGTYLNRESAIVAPQSVDRLREVFLLPDYLTEQEEADLVRLPVEMRAAYLRERELTPLPNPEALAALSSADVIIYGPGTQHSSLLPSYLTQGVVEAIARNREATKVFISNISRDHDIQSETVNGLVDNFVRYMSRKGKVVLEPDKIVTHYFFQAPPEQVERTSSLPFDAMHFHSGNGEVRLMNWEEAEGKHHGGVVLYEILSIVEKKMARLASAFHYMVSIVVPTLNEERMVGAVLHELELLDLQRLGLAKEIVLVDGGSTDRTLEIARRSKGISIWQLPKPGGRGDALILGAQKARGDVVVFFPADNEYAVEDIPGVIRPILAEQTNVVFGSRLIKCRSMEGVIRDVYGGRLVPFMISKYGGLLLSSLSLLLYNRFVSDPLTSVKAFRTSTLRQFGLRSHGFDIEGEIIAKASVRQEYLFEVPVSYKPRENLREKKNTVWQGVKTVFALVFRRH